ncbi:MAG: TetR/AcrR family transcriptional regulator [Acidimicrobiia bacterium]
MTTKTDKPHLSRDRVLETAVKLADEAGMEGLTIRSLASALGVKPMTIYYHVPSKEAIVDGMVDMVFAEIALPPSGVDWKRAIRTRYVSARQVLNRHPWAPPVMESRTSPGADSLRHHDEVLGCFRRGGLSVELTAHAYAILDSYLYGFAMEEAALPGGGGGEIVDLAADLMEAFAGEYPNLHEFTTEHVLRDGYAFGNSFEFGLDLIIDGLERAALT